MELSIQERLKDLRVERGLTLEQLAEQTHLSKARPQGKRKILRQTAPRPDLAAAIPDTF